MNLKNNVLLLIAFFILNGISAQNHKNQFKISGKVTDFDSKPIANAIIYIDSVKTKVTTNKRGLFKLKLTSKVQHIGTFTDKYGLLSTTYNGEQKINFVYRDPKDVTSGDDMKIGMVYKQDIVNPKSSINRSGKYEDFSSVTQLLNARFPFVQAGGGQIKVGKGPNTFSGDTDPLIIIDNQRSNIQFFLTIPTTDIENIRVIRRGSEAAEYGSLGASNGVIIVKLKDRS
jgi:hypothetical protein